MNAFQLIREKSGRAGRRLAIILVCLAVILLAAGPTVAEPVSAAQLFPTIRILNMVPNESVTIEALGFPPNQQLVVTMGPAGTQGVGGAVVATTDSGPAGTFQETYQIPENLQGAAQITIRLQGPLGFFAYHWFDNLAAAVPVQAPVPSFLIIEVVANESVTIDASNFPPNQQFQVTMGQMGTDGIGGIPVATTNSGDTGFFVTTYNIPGELHNLEQIAIRLESLAGIFAHNWFLNTTFAEPLAIGGPLTPPGVPPPAVAPQAVAPPGVFTGIPALSLVNLAPGQSVTVAADNFPPNQELVVRMGHADTLGVGGTVVTTTDSGSAGTFQETYQIPEHLRGLDRIAVRLEGPLGLFAYHWFENIPVFVPVAPAMAPPAAPPPGVNTHIVQPGETLSLLAVRYGTTVAALAAANNLVNPNLIFVGQRLVIP